MVKNWMFFLQDQEPDEGAPPATSVPHSAEVLATAIRQEKKEKASRLDKSTPSLLADDMILYKENPKESTGKLRSFFSANRCGFCCDLST